MNSAAACSQAYASAADSNAQRAVETSAGRRENRTRQLDVIVLAGGTGQRLGGVSKPDVIVRGVRLLDHVLVGIERVRTQLPPGRVVVVAPPAVAVPTGVLQTLENPPLGGPVAGIAAGLTQLADGQVSAAGRVTDSVGAHLTAVVTCDAPDSWQALPMLLEALAGRVGADGACVVEDNHVQYLLGVYQTAALATAVAPGGMALRDVAVRRVLNALDLVRVDLSERGEALARAARDLDTWEDISAYSHRDR